MAIKDWQKVNPDLYQTDYNLLDHDIMASHNFVNFLTEWWHFSCEDRY